MDKVVQKCGYHGDKQRDHPLKDPITNQPTSDNQPTRRDTLGPTTNTRGLSGAMIGLMVESEEVPPIEDYQFKEGDHVVLQSVRNKTITGTVRWVGQVKASKEVGSIPIKAVGVETVSNDNVNYHFIFVFRM